VQITCPEHLAIQRLLLPGGISCRKIPISNWNLKFSPGKKRFPIGFRNFPREKSVFQLAFGIFPGKKRFSNLLLKFSPGKKHFPIGFEDFPREKKIFQFAPRIFRRKKTFSNWFQNFSPGKSGLPIPFLTMRRAFGGGVIALGGCIVAPGAFRSNPREGSVPDSSGALVSRSIRRGRPGFHGEQWRFIGKAGHGFLRQLAAAWFRLVKASF
jgi:hypothetical protein